jgi:hypothetical protein
MSTSRRASDKQHRWLSLVEQTGIVLSEPVLADTSPAGFRRLEKKELALFYKAREVWNLPKGMVTGDPDVQWISFILEQLLRLKPGYWQMGATVAGRFVASLTQQHETLRPSRVLMDGPEAVLLFVQVPRGQSLDSTWATGGSWKASPTTKLERMLRETEVEVGLLTNGEDWRLLIASPSETASWLTWTAQTWGDSPITLAAFAELLGEARFFAGPKTGTILQLVRQSRIRQADVADRLGQQVREALDIFVRDLDRIDFENGGDLLRSYDLDDIYEASVVLMMRLLFLLKAEESELLPHGNIYYARSYGVLHLLTHLETSHRHDPEKLGRSHEAFAQLLGTFRLVHEGSVDPDINVAPYGGLLFDPASYPLLEGRDKNGAWGSARNAKGLPIRDSVVRQILRSLKYARGDAGVVQLVSYQTLAVEQIGHMYEGLLDRRVARANTNGALFLFFSADRNDLPEIPASELSHLDKNELLLRLTEITGRNESVIRTLLEPQPESVKQRDLGTTDPTLLSLATPMQRLLRPRGIVRQGGLYVTIGADRRSQGAHYTPPHLTEPIVRYALEPVVYNGPADGKPKEEWTLRTSPELLSLKVCDIAMGSGAFLVQAVRYLANRLVETWDAASAKDGDHTLTLPFAEQSSGKPDERLLPDDHVERVIWAKRYIAERCIYGVDKNHLATEMAKLSLWIETLSRERPFTFLDHALRCGDSLLGITSPEQIEFFHIEPARGQELHKSLFNYTSLCAPAFRLAVEKRRELEEFPVTSVADALRKEQLLREARSRLSDVLLIADLIVGIAIETAGKSDGTFDSKLSRIGHLLPGAIDTQVADGERKKAYTSLRAETQAMLSTDAVAGQRPLRPFHWVLEFPEVFDSDVRSKRGFDAIVGNPPFMVAFRIAPSLGSRYSKYLKVRWPHARGRADLSAYFLLTATHLLSKGGNTGLITTKTIAQEDNRKVSLEYLCQHGFSLMRAVSQLPWPGQAAVHVAVTYIHRGEWHGKRYLDGQEVETITPSLTSIERSYIPTVVRFLPAEPSKGTTVNGTGFVLEKEEANTLFMLDKTNSEVIRPFLNGAELNSSPICSGTRFIIDFRDWDQAKAQKFSAPWSILEKRVKVQRNVPRLQVHEKDFWKFSDRRPELSAGLQKLKRTIVFSLVSKYFAFAFVPADQVFSSSLAVVPTEDAAVFGNLQSTIHLIWAHEYQYSLKGDPRYSIGKCFRTFPFVTQDGLEYERLREAAEKYHSMRSQYMQRFNLGLRTIYDRFHNKEDRTEHIEDLRQLHVQLDRQILVNYGWDDCELHHDFLPTSRGLRFTLAANNRSEILARLLRLNHLRQTEETSLTVSNPQTGVPRGNQGQHHESLWKHDQND